jgi:glycosyltransferase involved in cell wall biosynthesis
MSKIPLLSIIIITKNASAHISRCLASVNWADEIIVLDSGSSDDTLIHARYFTDKIYINTDWQGFGVQKNRALTYAQGQWVLALDADEVVTPALKQAILSAIQQTSHSAFKFPRRSRYCSRWIEHGGWSPDYVLRLFRRGCACFSNDLVHEQLLLKTGSLGTLTTPLLHYSFSSLEEVLAKIDAYSTASAQMRFQNGQKGSLRKAILHGIWTFLRTYILRAGFLDGREGFMLAFSNAEGTYYRYLKLMYLNENVSEKNQHHSHNL